MRTQISEPMKKIYATLVILFSLTIVITAQTIQPQYEAGRIWFKLKDNTNVTLELINTRERGIPVNYPIPSAILNKYEVTEISKPFKLLSSIELERTYKINFGAINDADAFIKQLQQLSFIEYAEKVPLNTAAVAPNDQFYTSDQWYLPVIQADKAWNISTGNKSVVVAIVDNAIQTNHPDLAANIWVNPGEIANNGVDDDNNGFIDDINGFDVADNDNNPNPPDTSFSHGTHVSGCAAAITNNTIGVASVGSGLSIMAVKVTPNSSNPLAIVFGYEGVQYAIAAGANVINMSWGSYAYSATAQNIMNAAHNKGIILVAAAGNDSSSSATYPAGYNHVIGIASAKKKDLKAKTSNYGSSIDVVAPGAVIYSTLPGGKYGSLSGTSMACPVAAGLCGLLLSINPNLSPDALENCLKSSADPMPTEPQYVNGNLGAGRINAYNAALCASTATGITPVTDQKDELNAYINRSGQLAIDFPFTKRTATVSVYNQLGQQLIQKQFDSIQNQQEQLEIASLANGIYFLVAEGNDFRYTVKFVK